MTIRPSGAQPAPAHRSAEVLPREFARGFVGRDRLEALVGDARIVVVVAPAGYGKSTFAAQLAQSRLDAGERVVWLSLSTAHGDPMVLLRDIAGRLAAGGGDTASERGSQIDPFAGQEALFALLLDALDAGVGPCWLVLNDFHLIEDTSSLAYVERLVELAGPDLRIVVTGRIEPTLNLAQRAARGEVCWLTERQLAFTRDEIGDAARRLAPQLGPRVLDALAAGSGGWPVLVGVALAALRDAAPEAADLGEGGLASRGLIRSFVRQLMREATRDAAEAALLEILAAQEQVSPPLLDWLVPGASASDAWQRLVASGLVAAGEGAGASFRLHPVVREIVLQELGNATGRIAAIRRRAAQWYWDQGQKDRAIAEATDAGDYDLAAAWLAEYVADLFRRLGQLETFLHHLSRLPPEYQQHPSLALNKALTLVLLRRYAEAEAAIAALPDLPYRTFVQMLGRGTMAALQDDYAKAFELLTGCAATFGWAGAEGGGAEPSGVAANPAWNNFELGLVSIVMAFCYKGRGEFADAHWSVRMATECFTAERSSYGRGWAAIVDSLLLLKEGRFRNALAECRAAIAACGSSFSFVPLRGMLRSVEALILYERNDLDGARAALDEGLRLLHQQGIVDAIIAGYVAAARVQAAHGAFADALDLLAEGERIGSDRHFVRLEETLRAERILLLIRGGQIEEGEALARRVGFLPLDDGVTPLRRDKGVRIVVRLARHGSAAVSRSALEGLLTRATDHARATGQHYKLAELLLQRGLLAAAEGQESAARDAVGEALALAAAEGYVRMFVDEGEPARDLLTRHGGAAAARSGHVAAHLGRVLDAFVPAAVPAAPAEPLPAPVEPLSERELQIVRLLAQGSPNSAIARRLFLTEGTVKWHLHNIYGKLGVSGRMAAVVAAQRLGLVASHA